MKKYKIGQKLKRKFADFKEVEITGFLNDMVIIKDENGQHYIRLSKVDDFFILLEPDEYKEIVTKVYDHANIDDPGRHNIAGTMNGPSEIQKKAFEKEEK